MKIKLNCVHCGIEFNVSKIDYKNLEELIMKSVIVDSLNKYIDNNKLQVFTICFNTLDFPNKYTVRIYEVNKGVTEVQNEVVVKDSLKEIRNVIPKGLRNLHRTAVDGPVIVESWI